MPASPHKVVNLSVAIVLFNSALPLLQRVLDSLAVAAAAAREAGLLGELCVHLVDNDSAAAYRGALRDELPRWRAQGLPVTLHELPDNRGFGAGHNALLGELDSEVHLVLNPDAELHEQALARGLAALAADPGIALLSPFVVGPAGAQEFLCKRYPSVLVLLLRGFAPAALRRACAGRLALYEMRDVCARGEPAEVDLASGCFMLVRSAALRQVGGFDEDFFLYFEDFDLSLRLRATGRLVFDPAMRIVHHGGYAARKGWRHQVLFLRSAWRFFRKHGWRWM